MHEDIKWFLGLIAVIVITAYVGWSTRAPDSSATDTAARAESKTDAQPIQKEMNVEETRQTETQTQTLQESLRKQQEEANASSFKGKLVIRSVAPGGFGEYVLIEATREQTAPVAITGLKLQAVKSRLSATIGTAWRLPFPNAKGDGETVFLKPGEIAYIISGRSANGRSFQLNSCTGYFEQGQDFIPSLPIACPHPSREPLPLPPNELSENCFNYISSLPLCATPTGPVPAYLQTDGSCQAHISRNISYDSCVNFHKNEPDFFRGDWRMYLNRGSNLWQSKHDTIELIDQNGKLISSYAY